MKRVSFRRKPLAALKAHVRELPYHIVVWKSQGRTEQAERAARILEDSKREIERRKGTSQAA